MQRQAQARTGSRVDPGLARRRNARVLNLIKAFLMAGAGVALGLAATAVAVREGVGFGAVQAGVWTAWPRNGTTEIDPYARAILARTGEIPLGLAEGLHLTARKDARGDWLNGRCVYLLSGRVPLGRYWTLTLANPEGFLIGNALERYGVTSSEIVRSDNGRFEIIVSGDARPGNWLPVGHEKRFILLLRLYDTVASASAGALEGSMLPNIQRQACQ